MKRLTPIFLLSIAFLVMPLSGSLAADLPKSGSFKTPSGFKAVDEATQVGDKRTFSHGVAWGIVTEDNPLHIKTAMCPYVSDADGDTISFNGRCAWSDAEGDQILTEWTAKFSISARAGEGDQIFTGGSGKFSGIKGSNPFKCQIVGDKGQFTCTQQWTYQLASK
jgi:hypothetical protein